MRCSFSNYRYYKLQRLTKDETDDEYNKAIDSGREIPINDWALESKTLTADIKEVLSFELSKKIEILQSGLTHSTNYL